MTWEDVRRATLQKMFSLDGTVINANDEGIKDYLNAMPQAANEALQLLCTAGKYLVREYPLPEEKAKGQRLTIDLKKDLPDFYQMGLLLQLASDGTPEPVLGVQLVAGRYLVIPPSAEGTLLLSYNAWPQEITLATPASEELELDREVVVLLPLYMASQLYKEDDSALATAYRNEFEAAFALLQNAPITIESNEFTSVTGWI